MACQIILIRERTGNGSTQIYLSFMSNFQPVGVSWNNRQNPAKLSNSLTRTMKQFYQSKNISHFNTFNFAICIERYILQRQQVKPCLRSLNELIITPRPTRSNCCNSLRLSDSLKPFIALILRYCDTGE